MQVRSFRDLAFLGLLAVLVVLAAMLAAPFMSTILWAATLSVLTNPWYQGIRKRLRSNPKLKESRVDNIAATCSVIATFVVVLLPFFLIGVGLFLQFEGIGREVGATHAEAPWRAYIRDLDASTAALRDYVGARDFSFLRYIDEHQEEIVEALRAPASRFTQTATQTAMLLIIALLTQFFMLRDGWRLREYIIELCPLPPRKTAGLLVKLYETIWAVFEGTVLVAIIQGILVGISLAIAGFPNALLLGVVAVILCIIPLLGAPVVYLPAAMILLAQGKVWQAAFVAVFGLAVISNVDNFLRQILIAGRVNLHPMVIFFSILGGAVMFGAVGVMAGPMIATTLSIVIEVVRERARETRANA